MAWIRRGGGAAAPGCASGAAASHRRAGFDHGSNAKFDDYEQSLVTLFQCFTTEHWRFVLNDTLTLDTENSLHLRAIFIIAFLFMSQVTFTLPPGTSHVHLQSLRTPRIFFLDSCDRAWWHPPRISVHYCIATGEHAFASSTVAQATRILDAFSAAGSACMHACCLAGLANFLATRL